MTTADIATSIHHRQITRSYYGAFPEAPTVTIEPAETPQVIGYWSLEVSEIGGSKGDRTYHKVTLASLRAPGQHRSEFSQAYHSVEEYGRLSMKLVPAAVLEAISAATGEVIPVV